MALRNQRESVIIAFAEMMLLFGYQLFVAAYSVVWFKAFSDEHITAYVVIPVLLVNAGVAIFQGVLNFLLIQGVKTKDVYKCKIWYYTTLTVFCGFLPILFVWIVRYPQLAQGIGICLAYIVYRGVSIKILKDFINEMTDEQKINRQNQIFP